MKMTLVRADPAGNITALVTTPVDRQDYTAVSAYILQQGIVQAQQVGFFTAPQIGGAVRLEMMGGEFCGNALRSAGLYWAWSQGLRGTCSIEVEISGARWPLTVTVQPESGFASAQMPLPKLMEEHILYGQRYALVVLEGIVHLVCDVPLQELEALERTMAEACVRFHQKACGILFFDAQAQRMTPVVYVAGTGSIVYEGSCFRYDGACSSSGSPGRRWPAQLSGPAAGRGDYRARPQIRRADYRGFHRRTGGFVGGNGSGYPVVCLSCGCAVKRKSRKSACKMRIPACFRRSSGNKRELIIFLQM